MDENTKAQQQALIAIGVAADEATARFAGKYELYAKSLKKFAAGIVADGVTPLAEARVMEAEELRRYAHSLKGVTANLSINDAYRMLQEFEQSVKDGSPDFAQYQEIEAYLPEVAGRIVTVLEGGGQQAAGAPAKPPGTGAECRGLLQDLSESLLYGKARVSEQIIAALAEKTWSGIDPASLSKICTAVEDYDYAGAMEMIDAL